MAEGHNPDLGAWRMTERRKTKEDALEGRNQKNNVILLLHCQAACFWFQYGPEGGAGGWSWAGSLENLLSSTLSVCFKRAVSAPGRCWGGGGDAWKARRGWDWEAALGPASTQGKAQRSFSIV